jgi:hypothetical protein
MMKRGKKEMVSNRASLRRLAHRWKCSLGAYLQSIRRMRVVEIHSFAVLDSKIPERTRKLMKERATTGSYDFAAG